MPSHDELLHRADAPACPTDAEVEATLKARIAKLQARAEKAEAALRKIDTFELMDRLGLSDAFKKYSEQLGWGLTPYQPECWAALDAAVAELARLRAAGTFSQGIEAALEAQPSLPEDPDENAYERGRHDGVIAYGRAIVALRRPDEGGA